jgi:predicted DNA-binding transcriptional regulator AlpA
LKNGNCRLEQAIIACQRNQSFSKGDEMSEQTIASPAVTLADLAFILNRSKPSLYRDDSAGRLPAGFTIGSSRRWLRSEIDAWMVAGCPDRKTWEASKASGRRA